MSNVLVFKRTQLQSVFKDFNTVKEFENLVKLVNDNTASIDAGYTGTFTAGIKTVTVVKGIITSVV